MTRPTANVFDNQSTSSSVLISLGGASFAIAALAGFMILGGMTFIAAVFATVIAALAFAVACILFGAVAAPLLMVILTPLIAVGYVLLGLIVVIGGFFYAFFRSLLTGQKLN